MNCFTNRTSVLLLLLGGALTVVGCATMQPYISNDIGQPITVKPSAFHQFTYIRAYENAGEMILYGKIHHSHEFCEKEGHVDLAVVDSKGAVSYAASLALRRQSNRQHGWYGAGFRMRIAQSTLGRGTIRLAFHDLGCHKDLVYDCASNQAEAYKMLAKETTPLQANNE